MKADSEIHLLLNRRVVGIEMEDTCGHVTVRSGGETERLRAPVVVNCLWENRRAFDVAVGIDGVPDYTTRFKYGVVLEADPYIKALDSITIIQGPFGNFVVDPNRQGAYCSWYPASLKGTVTDDAIPDAWDAACGQDAPPDVAEEVGKANLAAFRKILPGLPDVSILRAKPGLIPAEGATDIDNETSAFHRRSDAALLSKGRYVSINTGKYTSAPRNAMRLQRHLCQAGYL